MYQGSTSINMDAKGRIAIPAKYRDMLASVCDGRLVLTVNTQDRCAFLYPEPEWLELLPQIEALPSYSKAAVRAKRLLMGYATPLEMDSNGRLLVPPTIRDYANFDKKLMLVGQGKKFEIWDEAAWYATLADLDDDEVIPEEMMTLPL